MDTRRIILRLVAGGYLVYLGYQLLSGYLKGAEVGNPAVSIAGGVLFLIVGAWCVLSVLVPMIKNGGFPQQAADTDTEAVIDEDADAVSEGETEDASRVVTEPAEIIEEADEE